MRDIFHKIIRHPLISNSTIIFFGTLFGNVFNLFFTLFMVMKLSVVDNGTFIALISLMTVPSLAANAVAPSIINFAGSYFAKNDIEKVHGLYVKVGKLYMIVGLTFFIGFLFATPFLSSFFKIHNHFLLVIANFCILISFFNVINISFINAKLSFGYISFLNILTAVLKFILGVLFIYFGFALYGAVFAVFLSMLLPFIISFLPLRFVFNSRAEESKSNFKELMAYGLPSAITVLSLTSLITTDVLLVKHFFTAVEAGLYAKISIFGRIIFYFSAPIGTVMFPLIVQKISRKEKYTSIFVLSMALVFFSSAAITFTYFFAPNFVMSIFKIENQQYLLGVFGAFISVYALLSILINFYLSIKKTIIFIPVSIAAILQALFIWFFHDSFLSVIYVSLFVSFVLLFILLLYYPYATKEK